MHIDAMIAGTGIGLILIFLGLIGEKKTPTLLLAGACFLVITGVLLGADGLQYTVGEPCVSFTEEDSKYWNCSTLNYSCTGVPALDSCLAYNYEQCTDIANCTWVFLPDEYCEGTPTVTCPWLGAYDPTGYKCEETVGCLWEGDEIQGLCDWVKTTYHYKDCIAPTETIEGDYAGGWALMLIIAGVACSFVAYFAFHEPEKKSR